ncbi:MAG: binding-protein-dependent transport system inner rane component, partial [Thermomicrobiales bacterium]|nr:binding-protein-dependent transport system inner rane component [Thermomicrobiales bacterium]
MTLARAAEKRSSGRSQAPRLAPARLLRADPLVALSVVVLCAVILCGLAAPLLSPFDPLEQHFADVLKPPGTQGEGGTYWLGTDPLGRDLLSRIIYGARISLLVGVLTVLVRGTLGVLIGLVGGYYGGKIDDLLMRIADIQLTLPFLIVAIAVLVVLGPGLGNLIIVLGLTGWVDFGRVVRSETLSLRQRDFVEAARASGASNAAIMWRHILPNTASVILVISTLQVASVIIAEASLSFLGLGVPALTPTWGKEISEGRDYAAIAWWLPTFPGVAIFATVLAINILG